MKTQKTFKFGGIVVSAPEPWRDVSDEVEVGDSVFTLGQDDGLGALQFSIAIYQHGLLPCPTVADLISMVKEFGIKRKLDDAFDCQTEDGDLRIAGCSYRFEGQFLRIWYVTDGRSFAFVSYNSKWEMQNRELPDCEGIVRSIRFIE
jgi:hypothetical protein